MNRKTVQSSTLLLMEIILAVFFFAVSAVICVSVFVKAHVLSVETQQLNAAVSVCTTAAETVASTDSYDQVKARISLVFPEGAWTADHFSAPVDCGAGKLGALEIDLQQDSEARWLTATIQMTQEGKSDAIFETSVDQYFPRTR